MGLFDGTSLERPVTCERCDKSLDDCACPREASGAVRTLPRIIRVCLTRSSVFLADDANAPNLIQWGMRIDGPDLKHVCQQLAECVGHRLPQISGGKAVWVLNSKKRIAVMAQQWGWNSPKVMVSACDTEDDVLNFDHYDVIHLSADYLAHADPEVFLKRGY